MSKKLPRVNCEELIRALERAGFEKKRQKGSHLRLVRAIDKKRVTVPVHKGKPYPQALSALSCEMQTSALKNFAICCSG